MKSLIMALWYLSVSAADCWIEGEFVIEDKIIVVSGVEYYLMFAALMAVATVIYLPYAMAYREQTSCKRAFGRSLS